MEETNTQFHRPHRRHRSKMEIFKEAYLPYLILLAAAILIILFIFGAIARDNRQNDAAVQTHLCQVMEV